LSAAVSSHNQTANNNVTQAYITYHAWQQNGKTLDLCLQGRKFNYQS